VDEAINRAIRAACDRTCLKEKVKDKKDWEFQKIIFRPNESLITLFKEKDSFLAWHHFPEEKVVLFYDDPSMPWLAKLLDKKHLFQFFGEEVLNITPLSYNPGRGVTFEYTLKTKSVIGKTYPSLFCEPHLHIFEKKQGSVWALREQESLYFAGKALYKLHQTLNQNPNQISPPLKNYSFFLNLEKKQKLLQAICPELKTRINGLCKIIQNRIEPKQTEVIHGDFHKANLLVSNLDVSIAPIVHIIDMENICLADKRIDAARFLASIHVPYFRKHNNFKHFHLLRDEFLKGYGQQFILDLHFFEAAALLTSATVGFSFQKGNWKSEAENILREAERLVLT
jgi:hypothetical protein